ncbi:MAG: NAD-dependent epimerase/dehydratase family protein [Candidatus Kariarchaeaceae archaeon]|jgi:NAD dependent epimerase/dehydratase family enzyme
MKKVLVIGATGFVGNQLIPHLIEKKYEVSILTRSRGKMNHTWKDSVNIIEADASIPGDWMDIIPQHQIIVNLAGENIFAKRWTSKRKQKLTQSRVAITQNIASAINTASEQLQSVISVSGTDYYPNNRYYPLKGTIDLSSYVSELHYRQAVRELNVCSNRSNFLLEEQLEMGNSGLIGFILMIL